MAGSGPGYSHPVGSIDGGGWNPASSWYDKHKERKDKFLAEHPEWDIVYVRMMDQHEASTGTTDTELVVLQDKSLGDLMDRLEARYAKPKAEDKGE
jgi:hypothetical protein